jgi:hypothetical protein
MDGTTRVSEAWVGTVPEVGYQIVKVKQAWIAWKRTTTDRSTASRHV